MLQEINPKGTPNASEPLAPNLADINAHLHALFSPGFVRAYPDAMVEIIYGSPGNLWNSRWFSAFDLKTIAEFAEVCAANDNNVYVGASLRMGPVPESGRANTGNFLAASCAWIEFDDEGDAERVDSILRREFVPPSIIVTTGTVPHLRQHLYFRINGGISDHAKLKAINTALRDLFGSDDVTDPIRVMRLAGCVNTPTIKKSERGYVTEVVTVRLAPGEYSADELIKLRGPAAGEKDSASASDGERKPRRSDDELFRLLEASRIPGKWWVPMRDATASMVGRGWSDDAIRTVCGPYCWNGHDDPDLTTHIDTARKRWDRPNIDIKAAQPQANIAFEFLDMTNWDAFLPPPREWTVRDMIPRCNVFLLSGEGAVGKTLLAMQLGVAHALGRDWIGQLPVEGPFLFLGAEDDSDELHRRLHDIVKSYGASFADIRDRVHILSYAGEDATLAVADRKTELVQPTQLFQRLAEAAVEIQPAMICLDTAADVFAGSEISRFQVRQFVGLLRKLAMRSNSAVVITSHPSLTGIKNDTGLSGSTHWHNAVRARAYLKTFQSDDKDDLPDPDLRILEFKKSNYGPISRSIPLRWKDGVFRPVGGTNTLDRMVAEQNAERLFMALLDRFNQQNRNVSEKDASKNYAPTAFAKEEEAKKHGVRKADLEAAMRRLFAASKIEVQPYGPPSRGTTRLVTR